MKKTIFFFLIIILTAGCSQEFLDTTPLDSTTTTDYYNTPEEMEQALTAAYFMLVDASGGTGTTILGAYTFMIAELMSDDRFGGGGDNDREPRAICDFKITGTNMFTGAWERYYKGIYRCNMMIANIDKPKWESEDQKNKAYGQALFLRAIFYFDLSRLFGEVPLVIKTEAENLPKAPAADTYAQIASDLKTAIEVFPSVAYSTALAGDLGRANKWSAEALMARVFLFYTGYYETESLPLPDDGGSVTKEQVVTWLNDCISSSGYDLMPEFRNLWPYSVSNSSHSETPYKYAEDNNLEWYGEEGANKESLFSLKFSTYADWETSIYYSNQMNLYFGWRGYSYKGPIGEGWGMGTVNRKLWSEWPDTDLRKRGSILNVEDTNEGVENYNYGTDYHDKQMDETGLWQKKYIPVNLYNDGEWSNYSVTLYGATRNMQLDNMQDIVLIRFADVLLMHSELTETTTGIDLVRERAGLGTIGSYSLNALKNERRHELAFEGVRYFDILRWAGKSNLNEAKTILEAQNGVATINNGVAGTKTGTVNFRTETGGFLQIPNSEVLLSDGVLEQNPGWGADAPYY